MVNFRSRMYSGGTPHNKRHKWDTRASRELLAILLLLTCGICSGQNGKFYFIKDKDTLINNSDIKVFLEMNDRLIPFNKANMLMYPDKIKFDNINSIVVVYKDDTISFFNYKEKAKFSGLPLPIVKTQLPIYTNLFADKRNMYFTVDAYPFDTEERKTNAMDNSQNAKTPL